MASTTAPRLARTDEELQRLVALIKDVDSVELKITVPESAQLSAIRGLGLDPLEAQIRQVFFLDTPDLTLDGAGLVVRARRSQKKGDDSVVKLRPIVPSKLPKALRDSPSFSFELDATPTGWVCSGSMKGAHPAGVVRQSTFGGKSVRKMFTKEQHQLFAERAPEGLSMEDLSILGPIFVLKLKSSPEGYDRKLVSEVWLYPDGSRILELSTKCEPSQAFNVAAETRAFLSSRGVDLGGVQQTKTRTALEYFASQFAKVAPPPPPKPKARTGTGTTKR
jgi:hypothetical protein